MKAISVLLLCISVFNPLLALADDESDDSVDTYVWVPDESDGNCQNQPGAGADFTSMYQSIAGISQITAGYGSMPSDANLAGVSEFRYEDVPTPAGRDAIVLAQNDVRQLNSTSDRNGNVPYLVRIPIGTDPAGRQLYGNQVMLGPPGSTSLNQLTRL